MNTRHVLLGSTLIGVLAVSTGVPVGPSWAFDNPLSGVVKGLADDVKSAAVKKAEEQAAIAIKKLREEAHAQLEKQIHQIEENLKQQVAQIMKS